MYKKEKKYRGRSISFSNHSLSSTLPGMGSDLADCPPSRQLCLYSLILTKLHFPYFNIPPLLSRVAFCDKKGTPGSNQVKKTQKRTLPKMSLIIKILHDFKVSWSSKQKFVFKTLVNNQIERQYHLRVTLFFLGWPV